MILYTWYVIIEHLLFCHYVLCIPGLNGEQEKNMTNSSTSISSLTLPILATKFIHLLRKYHSS